MRRLCVLIKLIEISKWNGKGGFGGRDEER